MKIKQFALLFLIVAIAGRMYAEIYSGDCGENLNWTLNTETGVLNITGSGEMVYKTSSSYYPWNSYRTIIKTILLPTGLTTISSYAFKNCENLSTIIIPNTVTSIGNEAFSGCSSLVSIDIPNSVTSLGWQAFYNCSSLASVSLGNNITTIDSHTFYGCQSLTNVVMSNSLKTIRDYAFCNCSGLTSIILPNSVTRIEKHSFHGCSGLTSIDLPDGLKSIGDEAFRACTSLTSISIPDNVTSLGQWAFYECTNLENAIIGNGVTAIYSYTFYRCRNLTTLSIGNNVKTIWGGAFEDCRRLTNVEIPTSVTSIGNGSFKDCRNLTTIVVANDNATYDSRNNCNAIIETATNTLICGCKNTIIPNDIISIAPSAFFGSGNIKNMVIPDSVTTIGSSAFFNCYIEKLTIGKSVTSIGQAVFYCDFGNLLDTLVWNAVNGPNPYLPYSTEYANAYVNTNIRHITVGEDVQTLPGQLFYNIPKLQSIEWKAKHAADGSGFAYGTTTQINTITFTSTVEHIPAYMCQNMTYLKNIYLPNSVKTIGEYAFNSCQNVENIYFSGSLAEWCDGIYSDLMQRWKGGNLLIDGDIVGDVIVPEDANVIMDYGFNKCKSITSVYIPDHIQTIGEKAFSDCENLQSVIIGHGLTSIPAYSFNNCKNLTTLTLGKNIKTIYDNAFYGCENLTTIYNYRERPGVIYSTSFDGVDKFSCILYVPAGSLEMYKAAAGWKDFYDIREMGEGIDNTSSIQIVTTDNTATFNWSSVTDANTYTLIIWANSEHTEIFCSLTFNSLGYLTNINFGNTPNHAPSHTNDMSGLSFTVTGLEDHHEYNYELQALADDSSILDTKTGAFCTDGQIYYGIEDVESHSQSSKILRDGQIFIRIGDKTFTVTGQEVR